MAYDTALAERLRAQLEGVPGVTEKPMFGGLAFLVHGHMAVAASRQGGALVRVDPAQADRWVGDGIEPMVMRGREMAGWLRVPATSLRTAAQLRRWTDRALAFVETLPPKSR